MADLVTLEEVKLDLRITDNDHDTDIISKIAIATGQTLRLVKKATVDDIDETDLDGIRWLALSLIRSMFNSDAADPISEEFDRILTLYRDPTIA